MCDESKKTLKNNISYNVFDMSYIKFIILTGSKKVIYEICFGRLNL